jgi:serine/threonine protein phosphatase PrpC
MEKQATGVGTEISGSIPATNMRWVSAAFTHVGKVRRLNEDALLDCPQLGLWAVADGVGGASAGDWASSFTLQVLEHMPRPATMTAFIAEIGDQLKSVNAALRRQATAADHRAIATTVVALLFFEEHFACIWAGDSRLYRLRDGTFQQVNRDHSEVQDLVDRGILHPTQARDHPRGNVVTRAVGAFDTLDLDVVRDGLRADDLFLLCSDGLTKMIEDEEIARMLAGPVDQIVAALIETALDRGAPDNVTAIAVKVLPRDI